MLSELTTRHLAYHATAQPFAAMEIDYPNDASTGVHAHPRGQLLYAIEGVMIVRSAVGFWVVPPNRAVWLAPGLDHDVRMCGDVKIRTLFIDPNLTPLPPASCVIAVSPLLRELIVASMRVPLHPVPEMRDTRLMHLILDELRQGDVLPLHLPMPHDTRLWTICQKLTTQPDDRSTAAQWAAYLGVTAKTIHRLFTRETGLTFAQWRRQARLLRALEGLAQGDKIVNVAFDSGYASQSAFTVMFRKHFGLPPSAFYR
jgi:AraC-like DNA-binding protein